jgi:hypothetical protein
MLKLKLIFEKLEITYKFIVYFFIFLVIIISFFLIIIFQVEIIMYFFPDIYILNLNELFKEEVYLTMSNNFGLLSGYLVVDSNSYIKALMLSSSYSIVKYKRYVRKIRILRTEKLATLPLNNLKYVKPLHLRLVNSLNDQNLFVNRWLFLNLLTISNFFQKMKLLFWEFYEPHNYNIRKRKFLRYIYMLRNAIHTYPNLYYKFRTLSGGGWWFKDQERFNYTIVKNYNHYNVYKKFAFYIYENFFKDRIEPYRFHNFLKSVEIYPLIRFGNYIYYKWPGYRENYVRVNSYEHVYKYRYYNFFFCPRRYTVEVDKDTNKVYKTLLTPIRLYEQKGFHNNRSYFPLFLEKSHAGTYFDPHFSPFYNEKFLFSNPTRKRRYMITIDDLLKWNVFYRNRDNKKDQFIIFKLRDVSNRHFFWKRIFSRYGYEARDYFFKNYENSGNFKKYYMHMRSDLYFIPFLYKFYNFFFFFYRVYLNLYNFGNMFVIRNKKYDKYFSSSDIANIYKYVLEDNMNVKFDKNIFLRRKASTNYEYKKIFNPVSYFTKPIFFPLKKIGNIFISMWCVIVNSIMYIYKKILKKLNYIFKKITRFFFFIKMKNFFFYFKNKIQFSKRLWYFYESIKYLLQRFNYYFKTLPILRLIYRGIERFYVMIRDVFGLSFIFDKIGSFIVFLMDLKEFILYDRHPMKAEFDFFFKKDFSIYKNIVNIFQYLLKFNTFTDYFRYIYSLNLIAVRFLFIKIIMAFLVMIFMYAIIFEIFRPLDDEDFFTWELFIYMFLFFVILFLLIPNAEVFNILLWS